MSEAAPSPSRRNLVALRNLPLPEPHLALLAASIVLNAVRPLRLPVPGARLAMLGAGAAIGASASIILWATRAAGTVDLAEPDRLVTGGPYALTRHPMYEAWTTIYAAMAVALRNGWIALFLPALLALVHRDTCREDRRLSERFADQHDVYARATSRYMTVGLARAALRRRG